jgi:hypothetical protein
VFSKALISLWFKYGHLKERSQGKDYETTKPPSPPRFSVIENSELSKIFLLAPPKIPKKSRKCFHDNKGFFANLQKKRQETEISQNITVKLKDSTFKNSSAYIWPFRDKI